MHARFLVGHAETEISIADGNQSAILSQLKDRLRKKSGFTLATLNLDHIVKLRRSERFQAAYGQHDFVVADGNPVVWITRLSGRPASLIPGSDLLVPLLRIAADTGTPVVFCGGRDETLAIASERLRKEIPNLEIVAAIAPSMQFDPEGREADQLLEQLGKLEAGLCVLAMGAPKQEVFAARAASALPRMGFASLGASLDFIAGKQTRAPRWLRFMAMEWAWRLLSSPSRFAWRYILCAMLLPGLAMTALQQRIGAA